jgi:hypothetical protein
MPFCIIPNDIYIYINVSRLDLFETRLLHLMSPKMCDLAAVPNCMISIPWRSGLLAASALYAAVCRNPHYDLGQNMRPTFLGSLGPFHHRRRQRCTPKNTLRRIVSTLAIGFLGLGQRLDYQTQEFGILKAGGPATLSKSMRAQPS